MFDRIKEMIDNGLPVFGTCAGLLLLAKEIENGYISGDQRKLVTAKNRLFGKIDLKGIILDYDEKSKRIFGPNDDVNRQLGWDRSDGFSSVGDMEIPF